MTDMHEQPKITTVSRFEFSPDWWRSAIPMSTLVYWLLSPTSPSPSNNPYFALGTALHQALPEGAGPAVGWFVFAGHVAQAVYTAYLCQKHGTGFGNAVRLR